MVNVVVGPGAGPVQVNLGRYEPGDVRNYGVVGDGVHDDAPAIQRAADAGLRVYVAPDLTCLCKSTITLSQPLTVLEGGGTLVMGAELASQSLVSITGSGTRVQGMRFTNPDEVQSITGERTTTVSIEAHRCQVVSNHLDRSPNGIHVRSTGEWFDNLIAFNTLDNCIGAGDGPLDAGSADGEDRGDGITSWGGRTRIIGNSVTAKPGTDARIGIHVEGLASFKTHPATAEDETQAIITGNMVRGPFRRGIAIEGVAKVVVADNILPGGYTWWAICAVQNSNEIMIKDNVVVFDRSNTDQTGATYAPVKAALNIAVYDATHTMAKVVVEGNQITVTNGGGRGMYILGVPNHPEVITEIVFQNNDIEATAAAAYRAIHTTDAVKFTCRGNRIKGAFDWGIYTDGTDDVIIADNDVSCATGVNYGITALGADTRRVVQNNSVHDCANGIRCGVGLGKTSIVGNTLSAIAGTDISVVGTTMPLITANVCFDGNGVIDYSGVGGRIAQNNPGFSATELFYGFSNISNVASTVNTFGKFIGRAIVDASSSVTYIAQGSAPTDQWMNTSTGALITPA